MKGFTAKVGCGCAALALIAVACLCFAASGLGEWLVRLGSGAH